MGECESKDEKPQIERRLDPELLKKGLRCDLDQYEMLLRCSENKDMTEWNEWRKKHPGARVFLEGVYLARFASKEEINNSESDTYEVKLYLTGTTLIIYRCYLKNVNLAEAYLRNAHLIGVDLENADLTRAHIEDVDLSGANLAGAIFQKAKVSGSTLLWECKVNRYCKNNKFTDFSDVALGNVRIEPSTKQLLEYNIRRKNWEQWYKKHQFLKWLVKPFWWMSDYGLSTGRIILTFFALAFVFANIYYHWGKIAPPGIVDNLFEVEKATGEVLTVPWWLVPLRTLYFSIVTMTTLGFGDMYANAHSIWGHILLSIQVILGYVLLGALVTRFAVLFTAGGPAGKFADEKNKATENTEKNK